MVVCTDSRLTPLGSGKATRSWSRPTDSGTETALIDKEALLPMPESSPSASGGRTLGIWRLKLLWTTQRRTRNYGLSTLKQRIVVDTGLLDCVCLETEKDTKHF